MITLDTRTISFNPDLQKQLEKAPLFTTVRDLAKRSDCQQEKQEIGKALIDYHTQHLEHPMKGTYAFRPISVSKDICDLEYGCPVYYVDQKTARFLNENKICKAFASKPVFSPLGQHSNFLSYTPPLIITPSGNERCLRHELTHAIDFSLPSHKNLLLSEMTAVVGEATSREDNKDTVLEIRNVRFMTEYLKKSDLPISSDLNELPLESQAVAVTYMIFRLQNFVQDNRILSSHMLAIRTFKDLKKFCLAHKPLTNLFSESKRFAAIVAGTDILSDRGEHFVFTAPCNAKELSYLKGKKMLTRILLEDYYNPESHLEPRQHRHVEFIDDTSSLKPKVLIKI